MTLLAFTLAHPFAAWLGWLIFLLAMAYAMVRLWRQNTVKAALVTICLAPAFTIYAIGLGCVVWKNACLWTYREYLRKLSKANHEDPGL